MCTNECMSLTGREREVEGEVAQDVRRKTQDYV